MKNLFAKLLKVAVHLAVAFNVAGLLTALTHYPQFQSPIWIAAINLVQVLIVEGIKVYQSSNTAVTIDSLPDHNPFTPPDDSH